MSSRQMISFTDKLHSRIQTRAIEPTFAGQVTADLNRFYGLIDSAEIEMRDYFTAQEVEALREIIGDGMLDTRYIRRWPMILSTMVEDALMLGERVYSIDIEELAKKLKRLTPLQSLWIVDRLQGYKLVG